ncbi:MAG: KilA-N domain-containing protein [Bacteroidota bacterium]
MAKNTKNSIEVQGQAIRYRDIDGSFYLCITDMAKLVDARTDQVIGNWLRNLSTLDFIFEWEKKHNSVDFNPLKFEGFRNRAGRVGFVVSAKQLIGEAQIKCIQSKSGRYGGTYAHSTIAIEFCSAISPAFKLGVIEEYQRLKEEEYQKLGDPWDLRRELTKANYPLMTEATRANLVPSQLVGTRREGQIFASEADLLNQVVFGMTAKQWRQRNPDAKGNIRDNANMLDLLLLTNLQALNAKLIEWDSDSDQRFQMLTDEARRQRSILGQSKALQRLMDKTDRQKKLKK